MPFPKPPAIDDTSAWLTSDAAWVESRKAAWRDVLPALRNDPSVPRTRRSLMLSAKEVKLLETYFLTGKCRVPLKWDRHEYPSVPLIFRLWFHPDASEANWRAQIASTIWPDYDISMEMMNRLCDSSGPGVGGLEPRLFAAFLASPSVRSFLDPAEYERGRIVYDERSIASYRHAPGGPISALALILYYPDRNPNALARYALPDWLALANDPLCRWCSRIARVCTGCTISFTSFGSRLRKRANSTPSPRRWLWHESFTRCSIAVWGPSASSASGSSTVQRTHGRSRLVSGRSES